MYSGDVHGSHRVSHSERDAQETLVSQNEPEIRVDARISQCTVSAHKEQNRREESPDREDQRNEMMERTEKNEDDEAHDKHSGAATTAQDADKQVILCRDVRSNAVLKRTNVEMPVRFTELQRNTNLNEPPANWLHGGSKWENYLREVSLGKDRPYSSFKMAHSFPDLAGEVDAISDAENIKRLLKIPYSKGHVSMMVHRVGNTLLLEDFDIHKHLLRCQQDDWAWLRNFYYDNIVRQMQDKAVVKKNKSRDHLQNRNMFSKFLYYSLAANEGEREGQGNEEGAHGAFSAVNHAQDTISQSAYQSDQKNQRSDHQRTVVWNFEDLNMLIGTDLPIFGGGTHPCVSLRLRDMRQPINVLTGMDYWLDNLMCNVPELAMCYHLNGIVQDYELIKTEDIPNLQNSKFSPKVVKDIAQNILSFLRSNATKEGHTYWLFKGNGDDIVKLYDLTTLCAEYMSDKNDNKFTVPVGILMYRVARNMRQTGGRKKSGSIRTLLKSSVQLLDQVCHAQVVTSAHYLLSDLYLLDDIYNPELNLSDESDAEDDPEQMTPPDSDEDEKGEKSATSVDVQALCLPQLKNDPATAEPDKFTRYPPISGNLEERCREALKHVAEGLSCLDHSACDQFNVDRHKVEEQLQCNPEEVIPLHYEPISKLNVGCDAMTDSLDEVLNATSSRRDSPNEISLLTNMTSLPFGTWHLLSKTLLLRKAVIAYYSLANSKLAKQKYGQALKYIRLGLICFSTMRALSPKKGQENEHLVAGLMCLSGDAHLMMVHTTDYMPAHREDFDYQMEEDATVLASAEIDLKDFEFDWVSEFSGSASQNLKISELSYEVALEITLRTRWPMPPDQLMSLKKRLGNIHNERGVFFMNEAAHKINTEPGSADTLKAVKDLCGQSWECFNTSISQFESIGDRLNMALLHSNQGRIMRLCAKAEMIPKGSEAEPQHEFTGQQKHCFNKALECYQKALELLEKREMCPEVWDSITWELSSSYYSIATQLQDFAPLSTTAQEQVEKEVTEFMMKALKYCDCDVESPRQPTCQYRAATIHHRLASLYHNAYRNQMSDQKKKHMRTLAELHYSRASKYFSLVDSPCELLRVQLERFAMCEFHLSNQVSANSRLKTLQNGLTILVDCSQSLANIVNNLSNPDGDEAEGYREEVEKLSTILESRLMFTLQNLVRNANANKKRSSDAHLAELYKSIYSAVLKNTKSSSALSSDGDACLLDDCRHLLSQLNIVSSECEQTSAVG